MNTDPMAWRKQAQREIAESVAAKLRKQGRQATVELRPDGWPLLSVTTDKARPGGAA